MKRFREAITRMIRGISTAVFRFPLTVICLLCAAVLICYMISLHNEPSLTIQKLMFTFLLGSFLSVAAQFTYERWGKMRAVLYLVALILIIGYYLILLPAQSISLEVTIRTLAAVAAMFCVFIWVPSCKGRADFNTVALTHLKAAFTSALYAGVLSAGCAAIIGTVDILLFNISEDAYGYMMTIVWVLFATIYYLSLLPRFNSETKENRAYTLQEGQYPRFLEILVSYIAISLVAVYSLVLAAYFVKILLTWKWPSGQLGPMVLAYSAAGLVIFILASLLENRFAMLYRKIFPKVLIPIVILQLVSVGIRINAYGITESRYYVAIFGIFSIICGVLLSFRPVSKNGIIAILTAAFAILSVVPPVDAFTVSRVSQTHRLENILAAEGILTDGKITPKADVSMNAKTEVTNILSYLENRGYTKSIAWLPDDFSMYNQMQKTLGFEPVYGHEGFKNFFANIDMQKPFAIEGFDTCIYTNLYRGMNQTNQVFDLEVRGEKYQLVFEPVSAKEVRVSARNSAGDELVGTGLYDFARTVPQNNNMGKGVVDPGKMTFDVEKNGYKLRIIFQNINITESSGPDEGVDYTLLVLFGAPN